MIKFKKYLTNIDFTWKRIIIFAIVIAIYVGFINIIPLLNDTSFQDIAIYPDLWFLFAIIIVINCHGYLEASLKCFVFFLISQPLIYLIEALFTSEGFTIFRFYPHWFYITLLTLIGAPLAYLVKKKNWLSVLILFVATGYETYAAVKYLNSAIHNFPYHIVSAIICLFLALFFVVLLLDDTKHRIVSFALILVVFIVYSLYIGLWKGNAKYDLYLGEGTWEYHCDNDDVKIDIDNEIAHIECAKTGNAYINFTNENDVILEYYITISGNQIWPSLLNE